MAISMKNKIIERLFLSAIFIAAATGIILDIHTSADGKGIFSGLYIFKYFTLQSNLLVALYPLASILFYKNVRTGWHKKFLAPVASYILLTGLTYAILIAPTSDVHGLEKVASVLLHYVSPPLFVLYFFLFERRGLKYREVFYWIIYPLVFLGWGMYLAIIKGDYLYPFFDIEKLGYMVIPYIIAVTICGILLDLFLVYVNRRIRKNPAIRASE
jgi:hypothetical protein